MLLLQVIAINIFITKVFYRNKSTQHLYLENFMIVQENENFHSIFFDKNKKAYKFNAHLIKTYFGNMIENKGFR